MRSRRVRTGWIGGIRFAFVYTTMEDTHGVPLDHVEHVDSQKNAVVMMTMR